MFHNDCLQSNASNEKSKRHRNKKSKSLKTRISKQSKHSNNSRQKNNKYAKHFTHVNNVSDYLGPERLTKHVGFFSKGKISDSISRIEKIVSREVQARAKQDLREVLKLTCSVKNKHHKNSTVIYGSSSTKTQSVQSVCKSSQYMQHKTRFESNSWKDKLQKSVGMSTVNSVLASVHEPQEASPVKESPVIARKVLLTIIRPFIKSSNSLLFPNLSNRNKVKQKLKFLRNKLAPYTTLTPGKTSSCSHCESSQISTNIEEVSNTQNSLEEDFHLNPIFTGDVIDQSDITKIFPTVNEVISDTNEFISDDNLDNLSNEAFNCKTISSQASSSSIGGKSAITLIPTSPATSDGSPVWKLQVSPLKFVPGLNTTPTLYFRHKMF